MRKLTLRRIEDGGVEVVDPVVDGGSLRQRHGLGVESLLPVEWLAVEGHRIWLGEPAAFDVATEGMVPLFRCSCGLTKCGGIEVVVTADDRRVKWSGFREVGGDQIDQPSMEFDRRKLEKALEGLS